MPDESSDKPETTHDHPAATAGGAVEESGEGNDASLDPMSPEAIAKRVAALGGDDEVERIAQDEELKLAERRAKVGGNKKKGGGLEAAASKRLQQIGGGKAVPPKRVALAADANPFLSGSGKFGDWVRKNQSLVLASGILALAALVGGGGYAWWSQRTELRASTTITQAVYDELGTIGDPAKEDDEDSRPKDARPVFKTDAERRDAALAKYRDVESKYKGTGAAFLARLEEGSLLLDKPDLDGAIAAFDDASKSPLASADSEVKGRALEGMGLAYEAKARATPAEKDKWLDEAAKQFHALESTDVNGFKEMGMYHEARVAELKGDKDKAITLLKALHERLAPPGQTTHPFIYLETAADDRLRALDPTAIKPKPKGPAGGAGGANNMSQEQINQLIEQLKARGGGGAPAPGGGK